MKILRTFKVLLLFLMAQTVFVACGGDGDSDTQADKDYMLQFDDGNDVFLWNTSTKQVFLVLTFGEGIPTGSEWYLNCDVPWIKLRNTSGRIGEVRTERIPITIEDNLDYQDREANIYLDVPNGIPYSSIFTTRTILQKGLEFEFAFGKSISIVTNRSIAESPRLSINNIHMFDVMDIDWGDGDKNVLTKNDFYSTSNLSISHNYTFNETINVNLRFGFGSSANANGYFSFKLDKGQGIEEIIYEFDSFTNSRNYYIDNTKNVYVSYSEANGFSVEQR